jgi:N-acetylglucosamine malate deacetylase 1
MNPYHSFVHTYARLAEEGRHWPLGGFPPCARPTPAPDAPRVMIFSPHPDDEVVIGGLALRLLRESCWRVINVAVTQGSRKERRAERLAELERCCACIGFELVTTVPGGLENIQPGTRAGQPALWQPAVQRIVALLAEHRPRAILFPHNQDWNSTHVGTHWLIRDALEWVGEGLECYTVETEFWGAMAAPNLMVEITADQLADLITALTFHVGEVRRNPYHLTLPAWMIDNVRRGAELVGGQGGASPELTFATLYRLRRWAGGRWKEAEPGGRLLARGIPAGTLFEGGINPRPCLQTP